MADKLQKIFDNLKGKYKHYCLEWDGMPLDETSVDFHCCGCFEGKEFLMAQDKNRELHQEYWDRINPPVTD